jgi:hypothetical protein
MRESMMFFEYIVKRESVPNSDSGFNFFFISGRKKWGVRGAWAPRRGVAGQSPAEGVAEAACGWSEGETSPLFIFL